MVINVISNKLHKEVSNCSVSSESKWSFWMWEEQEQIKMQFQDTGSPLLHAIKTTRNGNTFTTAKIFFFFHYKEKKMFMIFMAVLKSYILTYVGGIEVLNFFFKIDIRKYSSHRNFLPFTKVFLWKIVKCIQNLNFQVQFNRLFFL